ncbi:MAG: DUF5606 domain-containing protein [Bacteroidota bacterium]
MKLNDIAAISGKGGLFKVLKPSRTGVVLESLDAKKKRLVANMNQRVSVLEEISIYTMDEEGSVPLADVFMKINEEFGDDPGVDSKSDNDELFAFLRHILPDFDEDKVYASDVKKLVSWYKLILSHFPERFTEEEEEETEEPAAEEPKEDAADSAKEADKE